MKTFHVLDSIFFVSPTRVYVFCCLLDPNMQYENDDYYHIAGIYITQTRITLTLVTVFCVHFYH